MATTSQITATPQLDGANGSRPRYPEPNEHLHAMVDIGRHEQSLTPQPAIPPSRPSAPLRQPC